MQCFPGSIHLGHLFTADLLGRFYTNKMEPEHWKSLLKLIAPDTRKLAK